MGGNDPKFWGDVLSVFAWRAFAAIVVAGTIVALWVV
jgi:hypothetical protein